MRNNLQSNRVPARLAVACCLIVMILAVPFASSGFAATALSRRIEAQVHSTSSFNDTKITACDIDGDGKDELLAGTMDGHMYCFTAQGKVKWVKYVGAAIRGGAACYDVDGDGKKEVFFGDMNGVVWGLGCNGVTLTQWGWPKQTARTAQYVGIYATPAIGDINGDGVADIVVGCYGHYVYAWAFTGAILPGWPIDTKDTIWSSAALADIDRDGYKEVIVGGDCTGGSGWPYPPGGLLWVFRKDGSLYPGFPKCTPEVLWSSPACADINNDGWYEIVVGTGHYYTATGNLTNQGFRVYAWNHDGSDCRGFPVVTAGCTMSSPAIGDVDRDGVKEIAIGCYPVGNKGADRILLIKGNSGQLVWENTAFGGPNRASPALADVNSDGNPDFVMGSGQAIGAWNAHGACIWDQVLDNFVISSPAVGDFDRDGHVEVAIATGSEEGGGSFYVFDCGAYTGTVADDKRIMPWPQFRENAQRTGEIPTGNEPLPPPGPANFHEYILVQNPCKVAAHADIELMTDKGVHKHVPLTVGPCSRSTVFVNKYMPGTSVSAAITSDWPVICERSMYFDYQGNWTGGHDVVGATAPSTDFYFAEGTCRPNFNPFICIQNPGDIVAKVTLSYMKGDGSTATGRIDVAPGSRCTVSPRDTLGVGDNPAHDFSTRVQCTNGQKIIAERAMYFNYQGYSRLNWTGGHDVVGAVAPASTFYFAEGTCRPGFDPYICVQNPGSSPASVQITYMLGTGATVSQDLTVPPRARSTVVPRDTIGTGDDAVHDFSARVQCTNGQKIVAERPMYFNYQGNRNLNWTGGHDVVGAVSPARTFYFAEGTCRPGFDSYIYIQNPGGAPRPGHPHYHERRRHHRVAAAHRGLKLEGDSGPRKDARERQRCRSRLLNQHHLHQRTADNRRAPDVLQLQRGLDRRARRRGGGRRLGGLVLRRGIYGHLASADQAVPPFV